MLLKDKKGMENYVAALVLLVAVIIGGAALLLLGRTIAQKFREVQNRVQGLQVPSW
ncbi:MAG: hypothetical protein QXH03_00155 [Candidatus Bathyarchaeia archaeon]